MSASKLKYVKFKNFRNFGNEPVTITFDSKINLLIGRNNTGKSNILRFLNILSSLSENQLLSTEYQESKQLGFVFIPDNHHDFDKEVPIEFEIHIEPSANFKKRIPALNTKDFFVTYEIRSNNEMTSLLHKGNFFNEFDTTELDNQLENYSNEISKPSPELETKEEVVRFLSLRYFITKEIQICIPKINYVSEVRSINSDIIKNVHSIVQPDYRNQKVKEKRDVLYSYFKVVFGYEVKINTFYYDNSKSENNRIELEIEGKQYPLNLLGSGIEQIVLIAFSIIMTEAKIICIDEPESHLHASAQRALLNMISKIEGKLFFFATHSNNFLDYEIADKQVFQIIQDGKGTEIIKANQLENLYSIIDDLGIRASEIYQTNGIIWVEGPSDRVYVKKWLELKYPELKEGLQFTFQYYGGKILKHYSVSDTEFTNYLSLFIINPKSFIILDSDVSCAHTDDDLSDTKKRIIQECKNAKIQYWVTKGKEIENYLTETALTEFVGTDITRGLYKSIKEYCPKFDGAKKVAFAREIIDIMTETEFQDNEDLGAKIDLLAEKISSWNK